MTDGIEHKPTYTTTFLTISYYDIRQAISIHAVCTNSAF